MDLLGEFTRKPTSNNPYNAMQVSPARANARRNARTGSWKSLEIMLYESNDKKCALFSATYYERPSNLPPTQQKDLKNTRSQGTTPQSVEYDFRVKDSISTQDEAQKCMEELISTKAGTGSKCRSYTSTVNTIATARKPVGATAYAVVHYNSPKAHRTNLKARSSSQKAEAHFVSRDSADGRPPDTRLSTRGVESRFPSWIPLRDLREAGSSSGAQPKLSPVKRCCPGARPAKMARMQRKTTAVTATDAAMPHRRRSYENNFVNGQSLELARLSLAEERDEDETEMASAEAAHLSREATAVFAGGAGDAGDVSAMPLASGEERAVAASVDAARAYLPRGTFGERWTPTWMCGPAVAPFRPACRGLRKP
ncbi:uncharacterized protein LOC125939820 [Dermacentor silvarum]|uniref:uncharacterized protein LOC125939820 n=1 Tax=Dermacentor silvarum TaxID=543639 RepID=UPI002100C1CA|nr:uncharacterized protein LOC125939820 [Dermacentor silvarum]